MRKSGRAPSGPGATGVPSTPTTSTTATTTTTTTTTSRLRNIPSLSFFSSSHSRSQADRKFSVPPATTGGVATFANGATFGDPFQPDDGDRHNYNTRTTQQQPRQQRQQEHHHHQQNQCQQHPQQSPSATKGFRRRANSTSTPRDRHGVSVALGTDTYDPLARGSRYPDLERVVTDSGHPPALPDFALSSAAKLPRDNDAPAAPHLPTAKSSIEIIRGHYHQATGGRMLSRQGTTPVTGFPPAGGMMLPPPQPGGSMGESSLMYQHIQELANKRISTLEYLRKAHEGRVYWFNTLLFDKPDLARMPYFDPRRLARRATSYLLLGLSLPPIIDLNSATPFEFLRSLNVLLAEFDSFQQLHSEAGATMSTLSRARIPQMFRRATPSSKTRRSSSANNEILYEGSESGGGAGTGAGGAGSLSGPSTSSSSVGGLTVGNGLGGSASVVSFGQSEADPVAGEEYVHLLTPSLPFDPDFFETFATLCDVLIDAYARLLGLMATPRDCSAVVAELFTKADARVRKIIVQGIVKEFEDTSRVGVKTEVANVGKVVIGGLM